MYYLSKIKLSYFIIYFVHNPAAKNPNFMSVKYILNDHFRLRCRYKLKM